LGKVAREYLSRYQNATGEVSAGVLLPALPETVVAIQEFMFAAVISMGVSSGVWCAWLVACPAGGVSWHCVPWSLGFLRGQGMREEWLVRVAEEGWGLGEVVAGDAKLGKKMHISFGECSGDAIVIVLLVPLGVCSVYC